MNQPNKPQNPDSLHVGETEHKNEYCRIITIGHYNSLSDSEKLDCSPLNEYGENDVKIWAYSQKYPKQQQLSEAGESKWIDVKNNLPEVAGFYWVNRIVVDTHTDDHGNAQFINEQEKIFYFKERNVTGWEKDWTGNPSNVTHWQPLPSAPNEINISPRLYTHAELLAFGEKVKELAAEQGTIIYIESETKDGIIDAEVDKQSILSIDLNKLTK
jgi:hypothetical protein